MWAAPQTLNLHAERRYKSLRNKLGYMLRPEAMIDSSSKQPEGWWIHTDADRVVVRERVNQYGRGVFKWEQVPSTIIDAGRAEQRPHHTRAERTARVPARLDPSQNLAADSQHRPNPTGRTQAPPMEAPALPAATLTSATWGPGSKTHRGRRHGQGRTTSDQSWTSQEAASS